MRQLSETPPCADWSIWVGREIEGCTDLGEWTCFVRRFPDGWTLDGLREHLHSRYPQVSRIWFCEELCETLEGWSYVLVASFMFSKVCACLKLNVRTRAFIDQLNQKRPTNLKLYIKMELPPINLQDSDHFCIGEKFNDRSYLFSGGKKVQALDYFADIRLA